MDAAMLRSYFAQLLALSIACWAFAVEDLAAAEKISAFVSIPPQQYFVQQVGGERVAVQVMVSPGANHETYEPRPRQMAQLFRAQLYFAVGLTFESVWLPRITQKQLHVIHTDAGIEKISMRAHDHEEVPRDSAHDLHSSDPHIWLSPPLVKIQAEHIKNALVAADPAGSAVYQGNFVRFCAQIDALHAELNELLAVLQGTPFMVFHPAWGYFAQAYGLQQIPIELHGKEPDPATLGKLIDEARHLGIKIIFVQPQFSTKSARLIADAIGAQIVEADPVAYDWPQNLRSMALKIRSSLK